MLKRHFLNSVVQWMLVSSVVGTLGACAGQGQNQDENLEASQQGSGQDDASSNDTADANSQGDVANATEAPTDNAAGADINSATTEDAAQLDVTLNGAGSAPASVAGTGSSSSGAGASSAAALSSPAAASQPGGPEAPIVGGRVRYVKEGGVQVMNAPGGAAVFTLEQGDHPVTWEENGWLKLNTGMYVPVDALTDKGIGRASPGKTWSPR